MSKVSIIVPVYNVEKYIDKCINSILSQTLKDIEIILVNDGSTDNSGKICDYYSKIDDRIIVIHKENNGLSSARNCGLLKATGDYISFIDSDDYIEKDMISEMYREAERIDADLVICDFIQVDENGNRFKTVEMIELKNKTLLKEDNILKELYKENMVQFVVSWNKLYKREIFQDLKFEEGRIHEDEFIIHRILFKCERIICMSKKMYNYVIRENSITTSTFSKKNLDVVYAFYDRMMFFRTNQIKDLIWDSEYAYINSFFKYYYLGKYNFSDIEDELNVLRRTFCLNLKSFLKNPKYNLKEKILWGVFYIYPKLHEFYLNKGK